MRYSNCVFKSTDFIILAVMERECLECGSQFQGRSDKKFCDDYCRNTYHNKKHQEQSPAVKAINKILFKNYKILQDINPEQKVNAPRSKLLDKGFNFNYFTNTYTTKAGKVYYFCYDKGYLPLENEWVALVTNNDWDE